MHPVIFHQFQDRLVPFSIDLCVTLSFWSIAAGPISNSDRCLINLVERSSSLPAAENQHGECGGSGNSSSVVQPGIDLVSITAPESTGCTHRTPQHNGHIILSPLGVVPLACISQCYGFQRELCPSCIESQQSQPIP